jgi:archaemetzincin
MFLRLVPLGSIPREIPQVISAELENINIKCRIMPRIEIPQDSYNHWRRQHNAETILDSIYNKSEVKFIDASIPSLVITEADLYFSGLNFVFGLEYPDKSCAIVSLARLKPEFYDEKPDMDLLEDRVVKEVLHELGHYLGLNHCMNTTCVMSFSPSVFDVDKKQKNFCDNCKLDLADRGIDIG